MLHYNQPVAANLVCLLFDAGHVVYSGICYCLLRLMRVLSVNQNIKAAGCKINTKSWQTLKHSVELRDNRAKLGDNSQRFVTTSESCHIILCDFILINIKMHLKTFQ